jgi:hypothetical protein
LQQGLDAEYQQYKDQIEEFFMNIKDRISVEDLRVYESILHQIYKKVNVLFVKNLLIFIVLTVVIIMSGYA